jgi:hypothetical protein
VVPEWQRPSAAAPECANGLAELGVRNEMWGLG